LGASEGSGSADGTKKILLIATDEHAGSLVLAFNALSVQESAKTAQ